MKEKRQNNKGRVSCILERANKQTLHMASVYTLLSEFPSTDAIANAHLTRLSNLLSESSKGRYGKDTAIVFRDAARSLIGSHMPAKSLELKHTIKLI